MPYDSPVAAAIVLPTYHEVTAGDSGIINKHACTQTARMKAGPAGRRM